VFFIILIYTASPIIITEVMSNVKGSEVTCGDRNEFVEIYNQSADTIDLADYFIYDFDAPPDEICPWSDDLILIKYPTVRIHSTLIYPGSYAVILDSEYCSIDTTGGNVQPYNFPDSTLILTTDETTIGNGITNNDPLIIYSEINACTTSFGTPYDSLDNFPADPGDGISWERIDLNLPDEPTNWHPSLDPDGCTPGRENSTTNAFDLGLDANSIWFVPASAKTGEDVDITIRVQNLGLRATDEYYLIIFDDQNLDSTFSETELIVQLAGIMVSGLDSADLFYTYEHPTQGSHRIGFRIDFPYDENPANNLAFKELQVLGQIGELAVSPQIFSPDGDGIDDLLQIDYRLPQAGGSLTISVFDMRGIRIHNILKDVSCAMDRGTVYWDGNSSKGKTRIGMYIIYLEYHYQNKTTKAKKVAVLAR
jgi:hypothetical protein